MKNRLLAYATLVLAGATLMTGCAGKVGDKDLRDINVEKYVTLQDYSQGFDINVSTSEVTDENVDSNVSSYLSSYSSYELSDEDKIMDRTVEDGDIVNIDYTGYRDDSAFDGGTAKGVDLEIGSHSFIEGFEEQIIGHTPGENFDINVQFPEDYWNADLAGVKVVFNINLNYILADGIDDKKAASIGVDGVTDVESLRSYVKSVLMEQARSAHDNEIKNQIIAGFSDTATFKTLPDELIARFKGNIMKNLQSAANYYGFEDVDAFCGNYYGVTADEYADNYALEIARNYVAAQLIANNEGLNPTDEEVNAKALEYATGQGYDSIDAYIEGEGVDFDSLRNGMMMENVVEYFKTISTITEN
ncbi:MAG: FKBP-type peptidyl-prolyl cis-trans isomerase [Acetatifactor sp.]|nr:FKBP-type peptidyl-prolyl cis-trans isomerase [Acetatifactor sp.]